MSPSRHGHVERADLTAGPLCDGGEELSDGGGRGLDETIKKEAKLKTKSFYQKTKEIEWTMTVLTALSALPLFSFLALA